MPVIVSADFPALQVRINDVPLGAYGVALTEVEGWIGGLTAERTRTAIPGRLGGSSALLATTSARVATFRGVLEANTLAEREARLATFTRALAGELLVETDDLPLWLTIAEARALRVAPLADPFLEADVAIEVELVSVAPVRYWRNLTPVPLDTVPRGVWIGAAGAACVAYLVGPTTGATTVTLRRPQGDAVSSFDLAGDLSSTQAYRIDFDARTVQLVDLNTGNAADAEAAITGTVFALDGRFAGELEEPRGWPSLSYSQGSGMAYVRPIIPL